ncbi:hypothetical protein SUGI_1127070 [Cryptomeria japonica]|uniref:disease resistance RPP13-like protein 4 n=1 Tax=Cryptomeria japonica TaxID=3369 RepID=UPI0024147677|nr:disease resistance RPP13-like protein 4 [Cryptomeria japonica]GLJ52907.1 hypothetical protein SUGI_1127070 [Cryptomeria japonica]
MEAIVGGAVAGKICEMTLQMTVQKLSAQISLVTNFQKDFEWLKRKLGYMKGFLKDAEQQCRQKESVRQWLQDVRDIAVRAEDILERCTAQPLYTSRLQSVFTGNHMGFRYKYSRKISKIKARIKLLIEEGWQLKVANDVSSGEEASSSTLRRAYSKRSSIVPIDSHPVGIEAKVEHLVSLLERPAVSVIAVVGMGGLGKTYLLQHVYSVVKYRFEKSIWLSISQSFSISKLQNDLASHLNIKDKIQGVSEQRAEELINAHLKEKKIVIVLDDVWKPIKEGNLIKRLGLTIGQNCKLVITTRNREVCRNVKAEIYEMERLSEEDSWKLFCIYGFPEDEGNRAPEHLLDVARNIAKECGNLPLAIKTTAASLAGCRSRREWDSKLSQLKEVSTLNKPLEVLKLSYDCLPAHLKACFAYLSFFPEDEKIDCEYLVNLWIAEGFIPDGKDQWDIGWKCLNEIANLCLVEIVEEEWEGSDHDSDIQVELEVKKYCRVHDLFLDLAVYISKENKCAFKIENAFKEFPARNNSVDWCRVLLPKKWIDDKVLLKSRLAFSPKLLRTLSLSDNRIVNIPPKILMNMKVLRVLDLSRNGISTLPDCVEDMKLLKVLNLSSTWITEVPGCVRSLKSLLFLDVSFCSSLRQIPVWIGKLKCLQHINTVQSPLINTLPNGILNLKSLRTLRSRRLRLSVRNDSELKLQDVRSMFQLQELSICLDTESQLQSIKTGILGQLERMRHLTVENCLPFPDCPFPEELEIMRDLETLQLHKFAVTSSLCSFVDLRELRLQRCHWNSYPEFQKMPNLMSLQLDSNRSCTEIPAAFGKSGGFPKLRFMLIRDFPGLDEFPELEDGAMPHLEVFKLHKCHNLSELRGLEKLKMLKEFNYHRSFGLWFRLQEGGQDWREVKARNPQVIITHRHRRYV